MSESLSPLVGVFLQSLRDAVGVSLLVLLIMTLVEAIDIFSRGRIFRGMFRSGNGQILISSLLGAIPGCAGGFAVVSLYTHRVVSFGALLAMMIATAGDEAFLMLALFPGKALLLLGILLVLGLVCGWAADRLGIGKNLTTGRCEETFEAELPEESAPKVSVRTFFREHVWHHIILRHLPGIFGWVFGIMFLFGVLGLYFDLESWIGSNPVAMILLATVIGFIPESGPHIAFVTLFANGIIPFPVLLANMITQDGHASLPLLAESKRTFVQVKLLKAVPGILLPLLLLLF